MIDPRKSGSSRSTDNKGKQALLTVWLSEPLKRRTWLDWILATVLGGAVGGIALQVGIGRGRFVWLIGFWLISFGILGLAIGLAQSLVLRRIFHRPDKSIRIEIQWTLASLVGCFVGGMASSLATVTLALLLMAGLRVDYTWMYRFGGPVLWTSTVLLSAIAVGVFQWIVLRPRFDSLQKWAWMSIAGWCAGLAIGWGVAQLIPGGDVAKGLAGGAVGGTVLGAITGGALAWLLAASPPGDGGGT